MPQSDRSGFSYWLYTGYLGPWGICLAEPQFPSLWLPQKMSLAIFILQGFYKEWMIKCD